MDIHQYKTFHEMHFGQELLYQNSRGHVLTFSLTKSYVDSVPSTPLTSVIPAQWTGFGPAFCQCSVTIDHLAGSWVLCYCFCMYIKVRGAIVVRVIHAVLACPC